MTLPTNIDSTYVDKSPGDKLHQQHHDVVHAAVNDYLARAASGGDLFPGAIDTAITQAVQNHTPGIELGAQRRNSNFTTTNTDATNSVGNIPAFSIDVVGKGRPVELRFYASTVYHSVANSAVIVSIVCNDNVLDINSQLGARLSPSTTTGPSLEVTHRTDVLTNGVTYNFKARVFGSVAGTCTLVAAGYCPLEFNATSR